jgi:hypothetical protein
VTTTDDTAVIRQVIIDWVLRGWHLQTGEIFNFRAQLERFYKWDTADVVLHDNADANRTTAAILGTSRHGNRGRETSPGTCEMSHEMPGETGVAVRDWHQVRFSGDAANHQIRY